MYPSAEAEELWWARTALSRGMTLEEFDARCGVIHDDNPSCT